MRSNCLFFAIALYYRRHRKGKLGYVISRKSKYGWWPHWMYQYRINNKVKQVGYSPSNPKHKKFPPPIFHGKVVWGDE